MTSIYELTIRHLVDDFGIDPSLISPETTLAELDLDSLSLAELAVILQEQTGIRLDDMSADSSLEDIVRRIDGARADAPAAVVR